MRWALSISAVIVLAAAIGWSLFSGADAPPGPVPDDPAEHAPAPPEPPAPPPVAAVRALDAGRATLDAGARAPTVDVLFEVFGDAGHAAGAHVSFHADVTDKYQRWRSRRDPDADFGDEVGAGRTNVMGFTTVTLPPGRWRVKPPAEPQYVTVRETTRELAVHLRSADVVRGIVIDEKGAGVPLADVLLERDVGEPKAFINDGIRVHVGKDGRFEFATFDSTLTLAVRQRPGRDDDVFKKRINVPSPEVRLYLGKPGFVHFTVSGIGDEPIGVEFESFGITGFDTLGPSRRMAVIPGHVKLRARAVRRELRFAGAAEADVKAGEDTEVKLDLAPTRGQRVHLVDTERAPVRDAQVLMRSPPHAAAATTDASGDAWFSPGTSRNAQLEVTGRCLAPMPVVTVMDDELTAVVVPCAGAPDSGVAADAGYDLEP